MRKHTIPSQQEKEILDRVCFHFNVKSCKGQTKNSLIDWICLQIFIRSFISRVQDFILGVMERAYKYGVKLRVWGHESKWSLETKSGSKRFWEEKCEIQAVGEVRDMWDVEVW